MVQKHGHIVHLVRAHYERAVVAEVARHYLAEHAFRGNVQSVRGFVHEQQTRVGRQCKRHEGFLLLPHRKAREMGLGRESEVVHAALEDFVVEARIETCVDFGIALHGDVGEFKFFGHEEHFAQRLHVAPFHIVPFKADLSLLGVEQTADEVEQGALARTVLAQKAVDVAGLETQAEAVEEKRTAPPVAELDVFYLEHSSNERCIVRSTVLVL